MRLELTGRHVDITPSLRRLVETKLARLERLLNDRAVSAQAVLTREKNSFRTDITLHARGEKFLHGRASAAAWGPSLVQAIGKIVHQAQTVKGKWQERKRGAVRTNGALAAAAPQERKTAGRSTESRARVRTPKASIPSPKAVSPLPDFVIGIRAERRTLATMSVADAARQIGEEGIVVFLDAETNVVSVLHRHSGGLTLVQTEA